jgi:hypothetical protein
MRTQSNTGFEPRGQRRDIRKLRRFALSKKYLERLIPAKTLTLTTFLLAMAGIKPSPAQTSDPQITQKKSPFDTTTDVSLGVFGQLTPTRIPITTFSSTTGSWVQQTTQGTTPSAGVLGVFHQQFNPWLGYNVNFGYSRFTENYSMGYATTNSPGSLRQGSIRTNMFELSGAYVVQGPHTPRFGTFAQVGGGVLPFLPTQNPSPGSVNFRAAMVFGVGANYQLTQHLGLRAEYRGLFYKNPDFRVAGSLPVSKLFTVTSEPTISVFYTFGGGSKKQKSAAATH